MLYRVFPHDPDAAAPDPGGALHVPRLRQGTGRHDNPELYGALYASQTAHGAVAEFIQAFRGQEVDDGDFRRADGLVWSLAEIDDANVRAAVDLDDPSELTRRRLRPSRVATGDREVTQTIARDIFDEGVDGFAWWSVLEAAWTNVTLFAERVTERLFLMSAPEALAVVAAPVRRAAAELGVGLRP